MQKHIRLYIDGCQACQRTKTHHEQPRNPLHPNRIPTEPWTHVSSDLITGLPESGGFNAILVVVDRFSKMIVLIPTRDTITAPQMAENFRDYIWKQFGMPEQIISDQGTQYVAQFTKDLHKLTNTTTNISTAYHPQTDGQIERINQETDWNQCFLAQNLHTTTKFKHQLAFHHFTLIKDDILALMYPSPKMSKVNPLSNSHNP